MRTVGTVLVGVDAGASLSRAVVADESLKVLARASGAPGAVAPEAVGDSADAILATVRRALVEAGAAGVRRLVVGAAGAGREEERAALERALSGASVADRVRVTTDVEIGLAAAFGTAPGILLLAGTGSVGCARLPSGELVRSGGHGWQFGDEGSGYWLARAALAAVAQAADGRGAETGLTGRLAEVANVSTTGALLHWARGAPRPAVAALGRMVQEVATSGDVVARRLTDQAAGHLAAHVRALARHFPAGASIPVALAGGVLSQGSAVRAALIPLLGGSAPRLTVRQAPVEPALGAVRLAGELGA